MGTRASTGVKQPRAPARSLRVADAPPWRGPLVSELALASRAEPFSMAGWLYELKYDGFRLLAAKDGDAVTLRYRSGRDATGAFPEVVAAVGALPVRRSLLDGELVVFSEDGRPDYDLLRSRALRRTGRTRANRGPAARACLFDVLALDDRDLRSVPLVGRKSVLEEMLASPRELVFVEHVKGRGEELLAGARKLGLEGVVAKRADSRYIPGRTGAWIKFKAEETSDFVVVGIAEPSEGTFWQRGLVLGINDGTSLRYAGRVGIGWEASAELEGVVPLLRRNTPPCRGAGRVAVWLEPALVCEVRFLASSGRGLRHPSFVRFRPDKPWRDCVALPLSRVG